MDVNTVENFLTSEALFGDVTTNPGPEQLTPAGMIVFYGAKLLLTVLHYQITFAISDVIDYTQEQSDDLINKLNMVPGMKSSFLSHLKQDDASCPDGGVDPLYY